MNADGFTAIPAPRPKPLFSTRKLVHISMLAFAFLLPFLTWQEAAGMAILALLFNLYLLPQIDTDLSKRPATPPGAGTLMSQAAAGPEAGMWTGIILYPVSVLILILLYRHAMYVVAAAWAVMALGDGMAGVAGEAWGRARLPLNPEKSWAGTTAFVIFGGAGAFVLIRWCGPSVSPGRAAWLAILTALVGAAVESVPISLDDNLTVPLVAGGFLFCAGMVARSAFASNLPYLGVRIILALIVSAILALSALALKLVTRSGAIVGFGLAVMVYMGYGYRSFLLLLAFFVLGSAATRMGYAAKAGRGLAERRRGARSWQEATANVLAAAFFSILVITTHHERAFLLAMTAALAEACGDTVSSEIGQWLSRCAWRVTTWAPVPAGENGGVSLTGSTAGIIAAILIGALGWALRLSTPGSAAVAVGAALAGNYLDSLLGATLERRVLLTNGTVNLASTCFAGALALAWALHAGY